MKKAILMKKIKGDSGVTLIELLVSTALFVVLVSIAAGTFLQTMRTQRVITNFSAAMNDAAFSMEEMTREMRTGFNFTGGGTSITFTNADGERITYRKVGSGIARCAPSCLPMTSPDVNVDTLTFVLFGTASGDGYPPRITILASVKGEKDIRVNLQATVSSRVLNT